MSQQKTWGSVIAALIFLFCFSSSVLAVGHKTGVFWEVISPDGKVSHLLGTSHLKDLEMVEVFDMLEPYLKIKRVVLVEYIVKDENDNQLFLDTLYNHQGSPIFHELIAKNKDILISLLDDSPKYIIRNLKKISPAILYSHLSNPSIETDEFMDMKIINYTNLHDISLKGLEEVKDSIHAIEQIGDEIFVKLILEGVKNTEKLISARNKIKQLYFAEDLVGMQNTIQDHDIDKKLADEFLEVMVFKRNQHMLETALPELEKGNAFIALGAGHLAGSQGFLNLLEENGYQLKRRHIFH